MMASYVDTINRKDVFDTLSNGTKTIECRKSDGKWKDIKQNDLIYFEHETVSLKLIVKKVTKYDNIQKCVEEQTYKKMLPSIVNSNEHAVCFYNELWPNYNSSVLAIEVEII